ncbi:NAD-dependent epimerase/dehydratase family protein [Aestuariivivens sediminicola]|uniref:NAD-dependent epimerase/dehydratase family protein n=1 Tax=Aestuariivivens sediminicola TaxID=2913560 RepID=UPI001F56E17E|nr:NAD-dependent epimerase/dehydratase family protein [Aestuariivivens sediminicola]
MKILVTGAAGFIGSHTAEALHALGHQVIGVDNFSSHYDVDLKKLNETSLRTLQIPVIHKNLNDLDLPEVLPKDINYIFHFAAQPGISSTSTFKDYLDNNVLATKALVDYALELPDLKLFVNISTSSVYGLEATHPEDAPAKPVSFYGVTKLAAEQLVLQQSRCHNLKSCSLRLFSVIGPRERPEKMFAKLIKLGLEGKPFPLFEGSDKHLRSFTFVGDIVDGIVSVIGKESILNGEILNLGSDKDFTTGYGIEVVEQVIGQPIRLNIIPKRPGDQFRTKAIIDKARDVLEYHPKTSLLKAVEQQVAWYKANFM